MRDRKSADSECLFLGVRPPKLGLSDRKIQNRITELICWDVM